MNKLFTSYRPVFFLSLGWWSFWFVAQSVGFHRIGIEWHFALIESAVTVLVLATMGFVIANTFKYYRPVARNFYLLAGYVLILTAITGRTLFITFSHLHSGDVYYLDVLMKFMPLRGAFYLLMITFMTSFFWFRNHLAEQTDMKRREEEAESLMREAELARLRQQLQPHFLFNSLNSISALAGSKPEQARRMIQQLSDFLRGTLKKDEQQLVPLEEEFRHLQLYLEIEKVRFGHRLNTEIENHEDAAAMKLPPLLLQPIVENAVKFGLYDTTGDITISVKAFAENNYLMIQVKNPFDVNTSRPRKGTGFGLTSVQRRLYLLYARNDLLVTSMDENIFTTSLKIPQGT